MARRLLGQPEGAGATWQQAARGAACALAALAALTLCGCSVTIGTTTEEETSGAMAGLAATMQGMAGVTPATTLLVASTVTPAPTTTTAQPKLFFGSTAPPATTTTLATTAPAGLPDTVTDSEPDVKPKRPGVAVVTKQINSKANKTRTTTTTVTVEASTTSTTGSATVSTSTETTQTATRTATITTSTISSTTMTTLRPTTTQLQHFSCVSEQFFSQLEVMEHKGLCIDDTTLRDCPDSLPWFWPNTQGEPVRAVRLYCPWKYDWGGAYKRNHAWSKLVSWVKRTGAKVLVGTEVSCDQNADEEMWFWNIELMKMLGPEHILGVAIGNEMDMFQASRGATEASCNDELWGGRYWQTLQNRVSSLDLNGMKNTKVTIVWAMGVLGATDTPFKEDDAAKANTLVKQAYKRWPHRWVWSFNVYTIWDRSLWPASADECTKKTIEAVSFKPIKSILREVRRRIKMITGNNDDPLWIGENGWSSPVPKSLNDVLDICPKFGSQGAFGDAYRNFLQWDLSVGDGVKGADHAFYYAIRDDRDKGSSFGLMGSCKNMSCKVQSQPRLAPAPAPDPLQEEPPQAPIVEPEPVVHVFG